MLMNTIAIFPLPILNGKNGSLLSCPRESLYLNCGLQPHPKPCFINYLLSPLGLNLSSPGSFPSAHRHAHISSNNYTKKNLTLHDLISSLSRILFSPSLHAQGFFHPTLYPTHPMTWSLSPLLL